MEFPSYLTSVGLNLLALLAGVLSPEPSFVMAARTAVAKSRDDGLMLSLGLAMGVASIAALCLAGLHAVLIAVPVLFVVLVLSSPAPRAAYMRAKTGIDRAAAGVMDLLAARLISTAHHAH